VRLEPIANPPNPWASTDVEYLEGCAPDARLAVYEDRTRSILSKNDSPDVPFTWSVNPYRGCFHGCAYCYARPSHEYLSFGAGTDFERRIVVKPDAPLLLREAFERRSWRGDVIVFSGVTDCYQPLEASYRLTRGCLEVCVAYKNPVGIITKAPLIERDIDVLVELDRVAQVWTCVSIPFWTTEVARALEPWVTPPVRRMRTVERLAKAGLRVQVNVAPVVPGLGDEDAPAIVRAAKDAGAASIGWTMLRLPGPVSAVFEERLRAALPLRADRVLNRIREMRAGRLNDPRFGARMAGTGPYATMVGDMIGQCARRLGLAIGGGYLEPEATTFSRPPPGDGSGAEAGSSSPDSAPPEQARRRQLSLF
jgi:DNA repair photolyase